MTQSSSPERRSVAAQVVLGCILGLGLLLRLHGLESFPFEQDEIYTQIESKLLFQSPLHPGIDARPLYYLLQHGLLSLQPPGPVGWRLLPLGFGLLGIWVTWRLGRQFAGVTAGLVAAFFVAISPWHVYASGMARYWSLVYLLAASFYLLLREAYDQDVPRTYLAALLVLLLGSLTHPSFTFSAAGSVLGLSLVTPEGVLGWRWPTRRGWLWLWLPYAALLLAGAAVMLTAGHGGSVRNFNGRGTLAALRLVPAMVQWMSPTVFLAAAAWALPATLLGPPETRGAGALAAGGCGIALLLLLVSGGITNTYADYGIAMLPLVCGATGGFVATLAGRAAGHRTLYATLLTVVLAAGVIPSTVSHWMDGTRFDYRPALAEIQREGPEQAVLIWPIILQREYSPQLRGVELRANREYLDSILARERSLWAVVSVQRYGIVKDPAGVLSNWLAERCRLVSSYERHRLDYRSYRVELYRCQS